MQLEGRLAKDKYLDPLKIDDVLNRSNILNYADRLSSIVSGERKKILVGRRVSEER